MSHQPDYPKTLEDLAAQIRDSLDWLNDRLEDRTRALDMTRMERDLYRGALLRVLGLESRTLTDEPDAARVLTRDEVHDAIGSDAIGYLYHVGPPMRWLAGLSAADLDKAATIAPGRIWEIPEPSLRPEDAGMIRDETRYWRDPTSQSLTEQAGAYEKLQQGLAQGLRPEDVWTIRDETLYWASPQASEKGLVEDEGE